MFLLAQICLAFGIKTRRWLPTLFSVIVNASLAFSAMKIEIVSAGSTIIFSDVIVVYVCWFFTFVGFVFTLSALASLIKDSITGKGDFQETKGTA